MRTENPRKVTLTVGFCLLAMVLTGVPGSVVRADDEALQARVERMEQIIQQQQQQLAEQYELIKQLQAAQQGEEATATAPPPVSGKESPFSDGYAQQPSTETASPASAVPGTEPAAEGAELAGQKAAVAELDRRTDAGIDETPVDVQATVYDPSSSAYDPDFPGAWHLPGTTAAMKIGGYVNLAIIDSFDPIGSDDSFIVGTIPPDGSDLPGFQSGSTVTAAQSRINMEVREQTKRGTLRAFIEGDFEGEGDTFRLRHAYGQYGWMLAGKTWSTFANVDALPDEVDFEGVNGAVLQRQSQLRFFPRLGENNNLLFAIEDPVIDVQNGVGIPGRGDLIISLDSLPLGHLGAWNYKVAIVSRDLQGQALSDGSPDSEISVPTKSTSGWGITTSGRKTVPYWSDEDFVQWQLSYGEGIGHYINDLATIGRGDAVFDPQGELRALPVFAGYLSYNHVSRKLPGFLKDWPGLVRWNVMFSWVDIDNFDFQADDSYKKTWRASTNLFYFPTQNVRLGAELLWGGRTNKDDSQGTAAQVQFSAKYIY